MRMLVTGITLAMCLFTAPVVGSSERIAVSVGITQSTVDTALPIGTSVPDLNPPPTLEGDFSGLGMRLSGSVAVTDWLRIEAGWASFGKEDGRTAVFGETFDCPPAPPPSIGLPCPEIAEATSRVEQTGSAHWLALMPSHEYGPWRFSAKLGISRTEAESRRIGGPERVRVRESSAMYGLTAAYSLSDRFGIRADLDWFGSHARHYGVSFEVRI